MLLINLFSLYSYDVLFLISEYLFFESMNISFIDSIIVNRDDNNIIIIDNNQYLL